VTDRSLRSTARNLGVMGLIDASTYDDRIIKPAVHSHMFCVGYCTTGELQYIDRTYCTVLEMYA
jgi:hypothetical protein